MTADTRFLVFWVLAGFASSVAASYVSYRIWNRDCCRCERR